MSKSHRGYKPRRSVIVHHKRFVIIDRRYTTNLKETCSLEVIRVFLSTTHPYSTTSNSICFVLRSTDITFTRIVSPILITSLGLFPTALNLPDCTV